MTNPQLVFTAIRTGQPLELPPEYEDLVIAIAINLLKEMSVLDAEYVIEDILDAEEIG